MKYSYSGIICSVLAGMLTFSGALGADENSRILSQENEASLGVFGKYSSRCCESKRGPRGKRGPPGSPGTPGSSFSTYVFSTNDEQESYEVSDNIQFNYPGSTAPFNAFPYILFSNITYDNTNNHFVIQNNGIYQINVTYATAGDDTQGRFGLYVNATQIGHDVNIPDISNGEGGVTTIVSLIAGDTVSVKAGGGGITIYSPADITFTMNRID